MDLNYGISDYTRIKGNLPALPVVNMFVEQSPAEPKPVLQSRPGIANSGQTMGAGPIKALFRSDGVLSDVLYGISASSLYNLSGTNIGALNGTGKGKLSGFEGLLFATQGQSLYKYDGTTLSTVTTPGGFNVRDLCIGGSRLIVVDDGTGKFYWSDVLTSTIGSLSFATAENSPDTLKAVLYVSDTLVLFGDKTVEFWPITTDANAPFQPLRGRTLNVGIYDTGCATRFGSSFAWITDNAQICVQSPNNVISDPAMQEHIYNSNTASTRLWSFMLDGYEYLVADLQNNTYVYSAISKTWSEFQYNGGKWPVQCYDSRSGLFGSSTTGNLVNFVQNDPIYSDFGSTLERRFRAGAPIDTSTMALNNLQLRTNPGQTTYPGPGGYPNPQVQMRMSKDGGQTWGNYKSISMGAQGKYRKMVQWRSLGMFSHPGILVEFKITDPVPFRVSGVTANEPYGDI